MGGDVLAVAADLTKSNEIARLVTETVERFGTIHVLVNNAGSIGSASPFEEISDEDWQQVMDLNLFSVVKLT